MEQIDFEKLKERPHLFILGAGATKATIPFGDINGLKSPVMEDFLAVTGLSYILKDIALRTASNNIEDIYSELYETNQLELIDEIEKGIISYYSKMQIPAKPTLYDYLILFLRSKDCIATFNWDPLLLQAYNRVNQITKDLPQLIFLHGSVAVGLCKTCMRYEPLQNVTCSKCGKPLVMSKLLYPVKNKDYQSDIFIHHSWSELEYYLERAEILTIWGYSAPKSDVAAREIMYKAFSKEFRRLDLIEIIDIAEKKSLSKNWEDFAEKTNYHFDIKENLLDTYIGKYPRRSIDAYVKSQLEGNWNCIPWVINSNMTFDDLASFVMPLLKQEEAGSIDVLNIHSMR